MTIKKKNRTKKRWWQILLAAHGGAVTLSQLARKLGERDIEFLRFCVRRVDLDPGRKLNRRTLPLLLSELDGWGPALTSATRVAMQSPGR